MLLKIAFFLQNGYSFLIVSAYVDQKYTKQKCNCL